MRLARRGSIVGVVALAVVLAAAVGASVRSSSAQSTASPVDAVVAHASGGDAAALPFPSIVNVRLVRAQAALDRATALIDEGNGADAVGDLASVTSNAAAAWTAETYVIETAPPPVAGEGGARISGGAVGGLAFAAPEDTGFAVLMLEHTIVTTGIGLVDEVDPTVLPALRAVVSAALKARDVAIEYIHNLPAPPPPDARQKAKPKASTSGGAVASSWALLMPDLIPVIDDERQEVSGIKTTEPTLSAALQRRLVHWRRHMAETRTTVNQYWPPVVGD